MFDCTVPTERAEMYQGSPDQSSPDKPKNEKHVIRVEKPPASKFHQAKKSVVVTAQKTFGLKDQVTKMYLQQL